MAWGKEETKMNLKELTKSNRIVGEFISGSHAYGLNVPTSDVDVRGIFINPLQERISLNFAKGSEQVGDEKHDTTYYELARYMELAKDCNPNIIEFLWCPEDCWKIRKPAVDMLIDNRNMFVSKKAYYTFSSYAFSQIKKAKGQNKWINNPQPEEAPRKTDFCWVINPGETKPRPVNPAYGNFEEFHVAGMEHVPNMYRLYHYGKGASGVFRGPNQQLVCESIPVRDESTKFFGFLVFNEADYDKAMTDHRNYWEWMKNRNPHRYVAQEKGEVDYDCKNLMHCVRLLWSSENILRNGEPIIRFEGEQKDFLMKIRKGEMRYEDLMAMIEPKMEELKTLCETTTVVPHHVDELAINSLFLDIVTKER